MKEATIVARKRSSVGRKHVLKQNQERVHIVNKQNSKKAVSNSQEVKTNKSKVFDVADENNVSQKTLVTSTGMDNQTLILSGSISSVNIVTPSTADIHNTHTGTKQNTKKVSSKTVRRSLLPVLDDESSSTSTTTTDKGERTPPFDDEDEVMKKIIIKPKESITSNKRNAFGHKNCDDVNTIVQPNTRRVYTLINKMTGRLGGNGFSGTIYGELTIGSMQKMVELMKEHTGLDRNSRFIDVGSGLGKPNIHVTQDPGVQFSCGVEMEYSRWMLAMSNLNVVLKEASALNAKSKSSMNDSESKIQHRCIFQHGDITEAKYFDPFTHIYMFDIGFPPHVFMQIGQIFNRSQTPYLICYHGPKLMIDRYGFNVELITQTPTSMHGSSEVHTGYIYRRVPNRNLRVQQCKTYVDGVDSTSKIPCDPIFMDAWNLTMIQGIDGLSNFVNSKLVESLWTKRPNRLQRKLSNGQHEACTISSS